MNELIRELAEQATIKIAYRIDLQTFKHLDDPNGPYIRLEFDKEKFAELIVRECAKFLEENSGYDASNNAWHPEPEDLLNYFGVEE